MNNKETTAFMHTLRVEPEPNKDLFTALETYSYHNILSLDVATHCGWCTKSAFGVWDLTNKRDESGGMKLIRFKAKLREMCAAAEIDLIAFERTSGMHKSSIISQSELHGVLKLFCEENNIQYRAYSAPEIKKFATGKGNSGKPLMIAAARDKYGYQGKDDNEADAIHIYNLIKTDLGL